MQKVNDRWYLVGIVSRGFECARPKAPGLYVKVSRFQQWMSQRTKGK